jgi:hypothetical protein
VVSIFPFPGFTVSQGAITNTDWEGTRQGQATTTLEFSGINGILVIPGSSTVRGPVAYRSLQPPPSGTGVPGPLPVLGAAAAFGFSRKLRKRIKRSTNAISISPVA